MGIRITDQAGDQHTQNPPPDHDTTLGPGQTKSVATVTAPIGGDVPTVLRGSRQATGLSFVENIESPSPLHVTNAPKTSDGIEVADTSSTSTQVTNLQASALGWVRRDTGATQRIGAVEDHLIRKLPPRWTIAPTSAADQSGVENNS